MWFFKPKPKNDPYLIAILEIVSLIYKKLTLITGDITQMTQELDNLKAQVTSALAVEASAVETINGLAAKVADLVTKLDNAGKPDSEVLAEIATELDKLTADIKASSDNLSATVAANTPTA